MKKSRFLFILLILTHFSLFSYLGSFCLAVDYGAIDRSLDDALKLRQTGDIDGAVAAIQKQLTAVKRDASLEKGARGGPDKLDTYTKEYLQLLIECLKADEVIYISVVGHTASVIKKTRELFLKITGELETGEFFSESAALIKEMDFEMSREIVTHSFCVPPEGYQEVYNVTQEALFRYSKAWKNLYLIAFEKTNRKGNLEVEALLNFQMGNELFSQAGTLMMEISER